MYLPLVSNSQTKLVTSFYPTGPDSGRERHLGHLKGPQTDQMTTPWIFYHELQLWNKWIHGWSYICCSVFSFIPMFAANLLAYHRSWRHQQSRIHHLQNQPRGLKFAYNFGCFIGMVGVEEYHNRHCIWALFCVVLLAACVMLPLTSPATFSSQVLLQCCALLLRTMLNWLRSLSSAH